jgi:hypothetical protein
VNIIRRATKIIGTGRDYAIALAPIIAVTGHHLRALGDRVLDYLVVIILLITGAITPNRWAESIRRDDNRDEQSGSAQ